MGTEGGPITCRLVLPRQDRQDLSRTCVCPEVVAGEERCHYYRPGKPIETDINIVYMPCPQLQKIQAETYRKEI